MYKNKILQTKNPNIKSNLICFVNKMKNLNAWEKTVYLDFWLKGLKYLF